MHEGAIDWQLLLLGSQHRRMLHVHTKKNVYDSSPSLPDIIRLHIPVQGLTNRKQHNITQNAKPKHCPEPFKLCSLSQPL